MEFVVLDSNDWPINAELVGAGRIDRLCAPPTFDAIVSAVVAAAKATEVVAERKRSALGGVRTVVRLDLSANPILFDLFFNSAAGVRAQCAQSDALGAKALTFVRDSLMPIAIEATKDWKSRIISPRDSLLSLSAPTSKVWVHQGRWLRHAKTCERHILVKRWISKERSPDAEERRLVRYGSKAPTTPAELKFIGGWISDGQVAAGKDLKTRPLQIHNYGFT